MTTNCRGWRTGPNKLTGGLPHRLAINGDAGRHERHRAGGNDDVLCCHCAADINAPCNNRAQPRSHVSCGAYRALGYHLATLLLPFAPPPETGCAVVEERVCRQQIISGNISRDTLWCSPGRLYLTVWLSTSLPAPMRISCDKHKEHQYLCPLLGSSGMNARRHSPLHKWCTSHLISSPHSCNHCLQLLAI